MGSHQINAKNESAIWARLIGTQAQPISPETGRFLLSIQLSEEDRSRMQELMDRSNEGTLGTEDEAEFDSYLNVADFLTVMHSQARVALRGAGLETQRDFPAS